MSKEIKDYNWLITKKNIKLSRFHDVSLGYVAEMNNYQNNKIKDLQEKLDAAIRSKGVACLKHDLIHYIGCGHCLDEAIEVIKMFHHDDYDERVKAYERSRVLLKARNE